MNWWHDFKLTAAIGGGLIIGILLQGGTTWKQKATSLASGVFFAMVGTGPLIERLGLEFTTWEFAVAGLLAMSGDRLARRALQFFESAQLPGPKP